MKYLLIIAAVFLIMNFAHAQHSESNEYRVVAERMFKSLEAKDFEGFKASLEQAGMIGLQQQFLIQMKMGIEQLKPSDGWEEIASSYITERYFVVSFVYYTHPAWLVTLTFQKYSELWTLVNIDIASDLHTYSMRWGFLLNEKGSNQPSEVVRQP